LFKISRHTFVFLFLSAIATGLSWLFNYKALQLGEASRVAPIDKLSVALAVTLAFVFLGEKPHTGSVLGAALIVTGVLVTVFVR
jgi:transporter family protein